MNYDHPLYPLFLKITAKRGIYCEACGLELATELHHCLKRRSKKHPEYDVEQNLEAVGPICHKSGRLDTQAHAREFWARQVARGYDMVGWLASLNLRHREYFE